MNYHSDGYRKLNTINELDLTDISRPLHSTTMANTFFLSTHRTVSKKLYMVSHKTGLEKYKRIEIK